MFKLQCAGALLQVCEMYIGGKTERLWNPNRREARRTVCLGFEGPVEVQNVWILGLFASGEGVCESSCLGAALEVALGV